MTHHVDFGFLGLRFLRSIEVEGIVAQVINYLGSELARKTSSNDVAPAVEVDHLVGVLTSVLVASQDLPVEGQKTMRDFFLACGDLMMSKTRLQPHDRQIFEGALRAAVAKRHGY